MLHTLAPSKEYLHKRLIEKLTSYRVRNDVPPSKLINYSVTGNSPVIRFIIPYQR